jgi:23S rRNA pseudouridine2605 synthase
MTHQGSFRRIGLARALSKLGFCSRASAWRLIQDGRVRVSGREIRDPETPVRLEIDRIEVDGKQVRPPKKVYLIMNKPRGLVTTSREEKGRDTVYALLPEYRQWLAPVGRLDKASEDLLLFTNDPEWADRISSPENHIEKTYHVQISTVADENLRLALLTGIQSIEVGFLRAKHVRFLGTGKKRSWIEIVLDEGKNRHIRRMLSAFGVEVLRLMRVAIGSVALGDLPKGGVRELTAREKRDLDRALLPARGPFSPGSSGQNY